MDAAYVRSRLEYDAGTGVFLWKARVIREGDFGPTDRTWNAHFAGKRAGMVNSLGYRQINLDRQGYRANRLAWLYVTGQWPSSILDHRDLDKANDAFCNLRLATGSQNSANRGRPSNNTTGIKGVCWHRSNHVWQASIKVSGVAHHLGSFANKDDAARAYAEAAERFFGEFARVA